MKKSIKILIFSAYFLLSCVYLYSQVDAVRLDSTQSQEVLTGAWSIVNVITNGAQLIPGIPNLLIQSLSALILGLFIRHREKKALRKKGHLIDEKITKA